MDVTTEPTEELRRPSRFQPNEVFRRGDVVYRSTGPWTPTVHALLRHLEAVGFEGAPRLVGTGFNADGYQTLTEADEAGVTPDTKPEDLDEQVPWAMAWRARSAAWMLRHRRVLQSALA